MLTNYLRANGNLGNFVVAAPLIKGEEIEPQDGWWSFSQFHGAGYLLTSPQISLLKITKGAVRISWFLFLADGRHCTLIKALFLVGSMESIRDLLNVFLQAVTIIALDMACKMKLIANLMSKGPRSSHQSVTYSAPCCRYSYYRTKGISQLVSPRLSDSSRKWNKC